MRFSAANQQIKQYITDIIGRCPQGFFPEERPIHICRFAAADPQKRSPFLESKVEPSPYGNAETVFDTQPVRRHAGNT